MNVEEIRKAIAEKLKTDLGQFIHSPNYGESLKNMKKQVDISTKKMLAQVDADMHGYKIKKCDTMWNNFSLLEKTKWYWNNKITSKGQLHRDAVDIANAALASAARDEYEALPEEEQDFDWWELMDRIKYERWATPDPKSVLETELLIKPVQGIDFITTEITFDGLSKQLEEK